MVGIMKNKKAWLRILEAFIAIMLITSVLLVLYTRTVSSPKRAEQIYKLQEGSLDEIAEDSNFREIILNIPSELGQVEVFVSSRVPPGFSFNLKVCEPEEICEIDDYVGVEGKEVYSSERIISSTLQDFNPKKLKIFMWEE